MGGIGWKWKFIFIELFLCKTKSLINESNNLNFRSRAIRSFGEPVAEWSAGGRGVLEDPGSNPTLHYKLTIFSYHRVA